MIIWDAAREDVQTIARVSDPFITAGCRDISTRGAECERVHDIIDDVIPGDGIAGDGIAEDGIAGDGIAGDATRGQHIMTQ